MKTNKVFLMLALCLLSMSAFSGCADPPAKLALVVPAEASRQHPAAQSAKRFQQSTPQGPTAVETAIELSQKFAELSKENATLKQRKNELEQANHRLGENLEKTQADLQQAQKELAQANQFLVEMRVELNNWKNNVLGFRGEMRDAEKAQLEALLRILTLLGADHQTETTQSANTEAAPATSG